MTDLENDFPSWGETGEFPANGFFYEGGDQVNEKHLDALWHGVNTHFTELIGGVTTRVEDIQGNVVLDGGMEVTTDGTDINVTASSAGAYVNGQKTGATSSFTTSPSVPTSSVRRDAVWVDASGQIGVTEGTTTVAPNRYKIAECRVNSDGDVTLVLNTSRHLVRTFSGDAYAAGDSDGGSDYSPSSFGGTIREGDLFYNDNLSKTRVQTNGDLLSMADERDTVGISAGKGISSGDPASVVGSETVDVSVDASDIAGKNLVTDADGNLAVSNEIDTSLASAEQISTNKLTVNTGSGGWVLGEEAETSTLEAVDISGGPTEAGLTYYSDGDQLEVTATTVRLDAIDEIDLGGSQAHGLRAQNVTEDLTDAAAGQLWYRSDANRLKVQTSEGTMTVRSSSTGVPQDVSDSRNAGTWYQNTTGHPIRVAASSFGETWAAASLHVNDSQTNNVVEQSESSGTSSQSGRNHVSSVSSIVPDGGYYKVETSTDDSGTVIHRWTEQDI